MRASSHSPTLFQDLLSRVQEEHDRQLTALQQQVLGLRHELERGAGERSSTVSSVYLGSLRRTADTHWLHEAAGKATAAMDKEATTRSSSPPLLELRSAWAEASVDHCIEHFTHRQRKESILFDSSVDDTIHLDRMVSCRRPVSPNGAWRFHWEVMGLALVCFDIVNVPLQVFNPPVTWFSVAMDWFTLCFWTADMLQAFHVGFYNKGQLVMRQPEAFLKYVRTWFIIDLMVVGPDWFLTVLASGQTGGKAQAGDFSRMLRSARAMRVIRLLRIMKLQQVINKIYDMIDNEYSFIVAELIKLMAAILVLNHVIACGWFLIGRMTAGSMPSWVSWSENFLEQGIGYQYTTSIHWTLTQFTPASMDVVARNIFERIYSIVVLVFALVAFSSIIATVTSSMTIIRQMRNDKQKQFWMLRRYLTQKKVSNNLSARMTRFLEHQTQKLDQTIQIGKVVILQHLSDQLSRELAYEMFAPHLKKHPFFRHLSTDMKAVAARICQLALKAQQVATGDTVFSLGDEAGRAFVIKGGVLMYKLSSGKVLDPPPRVEEWLAEAVLWTTWRHRGKFVAAAPSELLTLDAVRFNEAMSIHPKPMTMGRHYGLKYVGLLNSLSPTEWSDVMRDNNFVVDAVRESGVIAEFNGQDELQYCGNGSEADASEGNASNEPQSSKRQPQNGYSRHPPPESVVPAPARVLPAARCFASACFQPCSGMAIGTRSGLGLG